MRIEITRSVADAILAEAASFPDREVCGLLFGTAAGIDAAVACANVAADPSRTFEIDPVALFAAHRRQRSGGPAVLGHYHSHPSGRAVPSPRDAAASMGDGALWLIVAGRAARLWRSAAPGTFEEIDWAAI